MPTIPPNQDTTNHSLPPGQYRVELDGVNYIVQLTPLSDGPVRMTIDDLSAFTGMSVEELGPFFEGPSEEEAHLMSEEEVEEVAAVADEVQMAEEQEVEAKKEDQPMAEESEEEEQQQQQQQE